LEHERSLRPTVGPQDFEERKDESGVHEEKRKSKKTHTTMEVKLMLLDAAEYFADKEPDRFRNSKTGDPIISRAAPEVAKMFPRHKDCLGEKGQNLDLWYERRKLYGDGALDRLRGKDGRPSMMSSFEKWIKTMVKESCEFGIPLSKPLLYECLCGALHQAQPTDELFQSVRSAMTDTNGDLWTPCYSSFTSWLVKLFFFFPRLSGLIRDESLTYLPA